MNFFVPVDVSPLRVEVGVCCENLLKWNENRINSPRRGGRQGPTRRHCRKLLCKNDRILTLIANSFNDLMLTASYHRQYT